MSYNRPPLLIGLSIIFWGWSVNLLPLGILIAISLELSLIISLRFEGGDETFDKISSLVSIITIGFIASILISDLFDERFIIVFLKWMPITMLPVILGQYYSDRGRFPLDALFYTLRKRKQNIQSKYIDLTYVYFAIVIAASCAANQRSIWFYAAVAALINYALYSKRSMRYNITHWLILILISVSMGIPSRWV
jgi:hypothetical protein